MDKDTIAELMRQGQADRRTTALHEMANALTTYFRALTQGGMDREEALAVVLDYHAMLLSKSLSSQDEG